MAPFLIPISITKASTDTENVMYSKLIQFNGAVMARNEKIISQNCTELKQHSTYYHLSK